MPNYTRKKWIDHITDQNGAVVQQGTPVSAGNLNNLEVGVWNANQEADNASASIREAIPSGFTALGAIDYTYGKTNPNKIKLGASTAFVNGWKIDIADGTVIDIGEPPVAGEREDLVFLEVWKEQISDTAGEKINSRIRVVQDIDFSTYTRDGFTKESISATIANIQSKIRPQGGNSTPIADVTVASWRDCFFNSGMRKNNAQPFGDDPGMYTAGSGDTQSKILLKTADSYVYAIPLFRVRRRNSEGYSVNNPNGAALLDTPTYVGVNGTAGTYTVTYSDSSADSYFTSRIGYVFFDASLPNNPIIPYKSTLLAVNTATRTLTFDKAIAGGSGRVLAVCSNRPDKLFANVIDERDIIDLRHQVSLTGFNYRALLEENFDKLLRGDLQTKEKKKMLKTYHGISKTPIDANTVFYASLDGTTVAEIGGALNLGTGKFAPAATGMGYKFNGDSVTPLAVAGLSNNEGTIDLWINFDDYVKSTYGNVFLSLENENGYRAFYIRTTDNGEELVAVGIVAENSSTSSLNVGYSKVKTLRGLHHLRVTWKLGDKARLYIDGALWSSASYLTPFLVPTKVVIGNGKYLTNASFSYPHSGTIADVSISNIDRETTFATLPQDFIQGYARIDKTFNGQRKTHSDALSSQYTIGIAKNAGTGHNKGITVNKAGSNWSSGDTIKVKGLAGEIISGVIDTDTALATVIESNSSNNSTVKVNSVTNLSINDTVVFYNSDLSQYQANRTITAIDTTNNIITLNSGITLAQGMLLLETTQSTSSPVVKFMNTGVLTTVNGTWTGLGTNEATFTLGSNVALVNADIQIEYSLNIPAGQGGVPEVYTTTLAGEFKGKKLTVGTVAVRDDFKGKVKADNNPMSIKTMKASSLQIPTAFNTEVETLEYANIAAQGDGLTYSLSTSVNGEIPQALIAVDIIKEVETKYGAIPSVDKVGWLKSNLSKFTASLNAYGTNPLGNKVIFTYFRANTWMVGNYSTSGNPTSITISPSTLTYLTEAIDNNGLLYCTIYTDASNGTAPSSIIIDYISIDIELKGLTGYDMLVPENPRRDDGLSNVLLVRKETKEIQAFFDCVNTDGVVTYGDYVPHQGYTKSTAAPIYNLQALFITSYGTGSYKSAASFYKNAITRLPKATNSYNDYEFTEDMIVQTSVNVNQDHRMYKTSSVAPITGGALNAGAYTTVTDSIALASYDKVITTGIKVMVVGVTLVLINGELWLKVRAAKNSSVKDLVANSGDEIMDYRLIGRPLIKK